VRIYEGEGGLTRDEVFPNEGGFTKEGGFPSGVMKHSHTAYDLSILQEQHLIYEYTETHLLTKLSLITYLITFKYHKSK